MIKNFVRRYKTSTTNLNVFGEVMLSHEIEHAPEQKIKAMAWITKESGANRGV